ncbi:hypothetical protein ACG02S_16735 [Roseateles sp. DC23W]|uniref:Uncharacterized protein n=1 Tax=Pelomonas dachongensis TaxID=3299029 RepID=A0ABW7EPW0_9BURK
MSDIEVLEAKHVSRLRIGASLPIRSVSVQRVKVETLLGEAHDHRHAVEVSVL